MYICPVDDHGEMTSVQQFVGTHLTGDSKYYRVVHCVQCKTYHFAVEMDATLSYASNDFVFRIELMPAEAKEMLAVMSNKTDQSEIEDYLNRFDMANHDRRVVITDEYYDHWRA